MTSLYRDVSRHPAGFLAAAWTMAFLVSVAGTRIAAAEPPRLRCLSEADELLERAVSSREIPGGVLAVGDRVGVNHFRAFGRLSLDATSARVEAHTIYDLASLTKAVATTTLAMLVYHEGRLALREPVATWYEDFAGAQRGQVRIRDLLAHSSGLPEWQPLYKAVGDREALVREVSRTHLTYPPGSRSVYSDLGMILLGSILERLSGARLDRATEERIWKPLEMRNTGYIPSVQLKDRCAPTGHSIWRGRRLRGEVHDENAHRMGGVGGHAGLFSTAPDLAVFARLILNSGLHERQQLIRADTVRLFTHTGNTPDSSRTLGWARAVDDPWAGTEWSGAAFGHTGKTGTALWVDPEQDVYMILLTNAVESESKGRGFPLLRRQVSDAVLRALRATCHVSGFS